MTLLTRWEPVRELATLQERMNRLFNDSFGQTANQDLLTTGSFVPPVDVDEDEKGIQVKMEVPGIDEKDIDVQLENNVLTVRGERKMEQETKEENYRRVERHYGSFARSFTLPNTVNPDDVKASYTKGVLNIHLGKKAEARPKQIKVDVTPELGGKAAA